MDAHLRDRGIHEKQATQGKQHDASNGEHSVRSELGFSSEEGEGPQNQPQRGKTRGKKIQREGSKQDKDNADGARDHCAGMIELHIKRKRPDRQEQEGDVRDPSNRRGCVP